MKRYIFLLLAVVVGIYGYLYKEYHFVIPCLFHKTTGLYCPGCGITRMIFALLQGNFMQAFRYNPLVFLLFPFLLLYFGYQIYLWITDKEDNIMKRIPKQVWYGLLIVTITFGVLRNVSVFSWLAPTTLH